MNIKLPAAVSTAIRLLEDDGYSAYIVGGAVRDFMLGKVPSDFDITTSALPDEIMAVFSDFRTIPTGIRHGTVTVIIDSMPLEITTYRIDGEYADNRHPDKVSFTDKIEDDLARRDFTVNAMAYNHKTGIVDRFGGCDDLGRRIIRAVGEPRRRAEEDALRILRALRFASTLDFEVEEETLAAARELRGRLANVSSERIYAELSKLICGAGSGRVVASFGDILTSALPALAPAFSSGRLSKCAGAIDALPKKLHLRLAVLLSSLSPDPNECALLADAALRELKTDNRTRERVTLLIRHSQDICDADDSAVRHGIAGVGKENFFDLIAIAAARGEDIDAVRATAERVCAGVCCSVRDLAVNGRDMIGLGITDGREIGEVLERLRNAVLDGKTENARDKLLALAKEMK